MSFDHLRVPPDTKVKLSRYSTLPTEPYNEKSEATEKLAGDVAALAEWQAKLAAQNIYALLVILQGIDASGKDGTVKHVMSGVNPAGCQVKSFKVPSAEELDHDYLWRYVRALPERGNIGIFNRSYYEEVLVVRVHPELLNLQHFAPEKKLDKLWPARFEQINYFERYLVDNGVRVLKFFLHLSKDEQKKRFLSRLDEPEKNWKFSEGDVKERAFWDDYQRAFEDMLSNTSTPAAPWYVVPADRKWFARMVVADTIVRALEEMKVDYPQITPAQCEQLARARALLENER